MLSPQGSGGNCTFSGHAGAAVAALCVSLSLCVLGLHQEVLVELPPAEAEEECEESWGGRAAGTSEELPEVPIPLCAGQKSGRSNPGQQGRAGKGALSSHFISHYSALT